MPKWLENLIAGWPMIRTNLPTFATLLLLMFVAIWWLMDWRYGGIVSNKDSEITLLKGQRDDYKEKLGGATPDQAKQRIDDLERKITSFEKRIDPRALTREQQKLLGENAKPEAGMDNRISVAGDVACTDCSIYVNDIAAVLNDAGWSVTTGIVMGPNRRPDTGLGLLVQDLKHLTQAEAKLDRALKAAAIPFNLIDGAARPIPQLLVVPRLPR
jgi:hypothetical protein